MVHNTIHAGIDDRVQLIAIRIKDHYLHPEVINTHEEIAEIITLQVRYYDRDGKALLDGRRFSYGFDKPKVEKSVLTALEPVEIRDVVGAVYADARVSRARFATGLVEDYLQSEQVPLIQDPLSPEFKERLKTTLGADAENFAESHKDYWKCICGVINDPLQYKCANCGRNQTIVTEKLTREKLHERFADLVQHTQQLKLDEIKKAEEGQKVKESEKPLQAKPEMAEAVEKKPFSFFALFNKEKSKPQEAQAPEAAPAEESAVKTEVVEPPASKEPDTNIDKTGVISDGPIVVEDKKVTAAPKKEVGKAKEAKKPTGKSSPVIPSANQKEPVTKGTPAKKTKPTAEKNKVKKDPSTVEPVLSLANDRTRMVIVGVLTAVFTLGAVFLYGVYQNNQTLAKADAYIANQHYEKGIGLYYYLLEKGNNPGLTEKLLKAEALNTSSEWFETGTGMEQRGDHVGAVRAFSRVIEEDTVHYEKAQATLQTLEQNILATALVEKDAGNFQSARTLTEQYLLARPDSAPGKQMIADIDTAQAAKLAADEQAAAAEAARLAELETLQKAAEERAAEAEKKAQEASAQATQAQNQADVSTRAANLKGSVKTAGSNGISLYVKPDPYSAQITIVSGGSSIYVYDTEIDGSTIWCNVQAHDKSSGKTFIGWIDADYLN